METLIKVDPENICIAGIRWEFRARWWMASPSSMAGEFEIFVSAVADDSNAITGGGRKYRC